MGFMRPNRWRPQEAARIPTEKSYWLFKMLLKKCCSFTVGTHIASTSLIYSASNVTRATTIWNNSSSMQWTSKFNFSTIKRYSYLQWQVEQSISSRSSILKLFFWVMVEFFTGRRRRGGSGVEKIAILQQPRNDWRADEQAPWSLPYFGRS